MGGGGWVLAITTAPTPESAEKLARALVEKKLVACASVVPGAKSVYWWKGRVEEAGEAVVLMKTRVELLSELERELKSIHPYEVPELIAVPIVWGSSQYLAWVDETLGVK